MSGLSSVFSFSAGRRQRRGWANRLFVVLTSATMIVSPTQTILLAADESRVSATEGVVTGTVWVDADADGLPDDDEVGMSGVTMVLTGNHTGSVATSPSDDEGAFELTSASIGDYRVEALIPDGYEVSPIPDSGEETINAFTAVGDDAVSETFAFGPGTEINLNLGLVPTDDTTADDETTTTTTVPDATTTTTVPESTTTTAEPEQLEDESTEDDAPVGSLGVGEVPSGPSIQALVACTPEPGYIGCEAFTHSGGDQAFTVPDGVTSLNVKVWGAGGGGSISVPNDIGAPGGSGGYVSGAVDVTPGDEYVVMTGGGGGADGTPGASDLCDAAYGFGGACAPVRVTNYVDGGGGGGLAGLFTGSAPVTATDQDRAILVAGGGGGGEGTTSCDFMSAAGGAGGNAFAGTMPTMQGVHGAFTDSPPIFGSDPTGGGGGHFGGEGTDRLRDDNCARSANGGSNFIAADVNDPLNLAGNEATTVPQFTVNNPPNTTDPHYTAGVGVGQTTLGTPGGNGLVVLQWAEPLPPAFVCDSTAYLFQDVPTDIWAGDLVTGAFTEVASEIEDGHINGIGYNPLDNYIYGWSNSTAPGGGTFPTGLVRIGSDYSVDYLGIPDDLTADTLIGRADVDSEGQYWVPFVDEWMQIDLDSTSLTFGQVVDEGPLNMPTDLTMSNDWAFNAADGLLYGVATGPGGAMHLISFDRTTHVVSDEGQLAGLPDAVYGAAYTDAGGFLYLSDNASGEIYRVDVTSVTANFFAQGPGSSFNDGARCAEAPTPIDFGDAPDSYATTLADDGPRHAIPGFDAGANTAPLMLGAQIGSETDGQPSPDADADTFEDGVAAPIVRELGVDTVVSVSVTNATGADAILAGWIDLDGNGVFDASELQTATVTASGDYDLTFDAPTEYGSTTARFRLFPGDVDLADIFPTGPASAGEVEDYPVEGPELPPFVCSSTAYLFQTVPTDIWEGDLVTGDFSEVATDIEPAHINGIGYNVLDDYIYGWSIGTHPDADYPTGLVRIGSDYNVEYLGIPDDLDDQTAIGHGDIDTDGHYWARIGFTEAWVEIDLVPGSENFGQVVNDGVMTLPPGITALNPDWSFNPADGLLYGVADGPGGAKHLVSFDRSNGELSDEGALAGVTFPGNYGATYMDADGFLYISHNQTGEIFRVDTTNATASFFAQGPGNTSQNDGARCVLAPLPIDFGDAPDSYGTLLADDGPRHAIPDYDINTGTASLMLGTSIDVETDGQPSAAADGDGADEDGVADEIVMIVGADTDVEVVVTNTSGEPATLAGWIDLNDDGVFDAGELQSVVLPSGGTTTETLTFPAVGLPGDGTFARFRLFPGVVATADLSPTGPVAAGEVEDYPVVGPVVILLECPNVYALQGGSPFNMYEVDTATGDMSIVGQMNPPPGTGNNNGMGISADARYVFSHRDGQVHRYDTSTGDTDSFTGAAGVNASHGAVDPSSGIYYFGNVGTGAVYAFDPATETNLGQVAELSFDVAPAGNNGDWSFDAQGNMYVVGGSTATSSLYVVSDLPTTTQGTPASVTGEQITTFSTSGAAVNGIAFDATGSLYAASNAVIFEINPSTGDILNTETLDPSGVSVDLASCATPSTIVVQKDIVDRFFATDQFEVTVTGGGIVENNVGVTEGTDTGVQDDPGEFAGTVLGLPGETYDISEIGAAGADLANYVTDWVCVNNTDGGAVVEEGTGVSGSFIMPQSIDGVGAGIECTFTNAPIVLDFGDAPDSYGTTTAANGPQHGLPGLTGTTAPVILGASVDAEPDGQPSAAADGDGADEDGVAFNPALGYPTPVLRTGLDPVSLQPVENTLEVEASAPGFVSVWVDWNQDGDFDDPGEQVANAEAVTAGLNDITFAQGTNPDDISTYVRVRYSTDEGSIATPYGPSPDGEVEDYQVLIERLNQPDACVDSGEEYYSFTFSPPVETFGTTGAVGDWARFADVTVINGVPVDVVIEVLAGDLRQDQMPPNGIGAQAGGGLGADDARWQITNAATLRYSFFEAGTDTPVAINGVFTVNDMDSTEQATFAAADLAGYAVTEGSAVAITESGGNVIFDGNSNGMGTPQQRFQVVFEGVTTFDADWQGGNGSGFGFDGDGDLSIDPPACSDFGDAPESYGTLLADDGARHTIVPGLTLGSEIDFDSDGQPTVNADGDDTNRTADEDGVADPIVMEVGDPTTVSVAVTNTTGGDATLVGWIDLNGDGDFNDAGEMVSVPAPASGDYDLVFPAATTNDLTYARFRLFPGTVTDPQPTGPASGGEVEDYPVQVSGYEVVKTADPVSGTEVRPGETVTYTLTLTNVGTVDLTGVEADDDLSGVLDDADLTVGPDVFPSGSGTASVTGGILSFVGDIPADELVTVTYTVTVLDPTDSGGDAHLENAVTSPGSVNCPEPAVTDPQDPEFNPDCVTEHPVPDLTVVKSSDPADGSTVAPGDTINYTLTITNTGGYDYTLADPAEASDDLSGVVDDAFYNGDADDDGHPGTIDYTAPDLTWTGPLALDEVVTVTYTVTVLDAENLGDAVLENLVTGTDSNCTDPPSDPVDPDCETSHEVGAVHYLKTVDPPDPLSLQPGDTYTYTVTASNIGATDLTGLTFTDDLTDVVDDGDFVVGSETADIGTAAFNGTDAVVWNGDLDIGEVATVTYQVAINVPPGGNSILINGVTGTGPGSNCPPPGPATDADCFKQIPQPLINTVKTSNAAGNVEPGDTVTYEFTVSNDGTGPARIFEVTDHLADVLDDATYNGDLTLLSGPGGVVFDTVNQEVVWTGPLEVGESATVTYSVTVNDATDLGDGVLLNAVTSPDCFTPPVTDPDDPNFNPDCVTIDPIEAWTGVKTSDAAGTVAPGDTVTYTIEVENTGGVDLTATDVVNVDDLTEVLDDASYDGNADDGAHPGIFDFTAPTLTWSGALAVDESVTLTYSVTVNDATDLGDGQLLNAITGPSNCSDPAITDPQSPDFDPDCVNIENVEAWTAVKTSDAVGNVEPGDTVNYTIAIENTGNVALDAADVVNVDDLTEVLDDATYDGNADDAGHPGIFDFTAPTLTWSGDLAVDEVVTLTYRVTVNDADELGDGQLLNAITGPTNCPDPAITDPQDPNFDPDCANILDVEAWTAVKTSDAAGNVEPGDTVNYTIAIENTGNVTLTAVNTDDLTEVLDDATYDGNADDGGHPGTFDFTAPDLTWTGDLAVDEQATLTYSVTVNEATDLGDAELLNAITGPSNCPDPAITDPTAPGFDPDCVHILDVEAWTAIKTSDAVGNVLPGETVEYTITVENTGNVAVAAVNVDDLTEVLDDASYDGNADDVGHPGTFDFTAPTLTWTGDLAVDETVTLTYSVTVNDATDLGDGVLLNAITGSSNCSDPAITDPTDPNFDPECVNVEDIEAWTAIKTSDAAGNVEPGDTVTYTITVENTGNVDLTAVDVVVEDDLTEVLDDASYDGNVDQGATYAAPVITWSADLAVDEQVVITYSVTINDATELGDGQLVNAITGSPNCTDPAITDPTDPNFDPDCVNILDVESWIAIKTSDAAGTVEPGATVNYTIEIENTGNVAVTAINVDDLAEVLDDASYDGNAGDGGHPGNFDFTAPELTWTGDLAVDEVVTLTYSVTVNDADELGDGQLLNAITGSSNCPDPAITDPQDPDFDSDCVNILDVEAWTAVKTSDAAGTVQPGDTVEYTITVENTGNVALDAADVVNVDDLAEVLDDASYDGNAADGGHAGVFDFIAPTLIWSGDLAVDETVTLTYSVTVNDADDLGDGVLLNAITGSTNCPDPAITDPTDPNFDPDCVSIEEVAAYTVVKTSDAVDPVLPGDEVEYTVTVTNTGNVDLTGPDAATFDDDLSGVLDDATFNDDESADVGTATFSDPEISWTGDLEVDDVATITYSVTVDQPIGGDHQLVNAVVGGDCPDPAITDPGDAAFDETCVVVDPLPGVDITKVIFGDPVDELQPGDTFEYVVTVENIGQVDLVGETFSDDLSEVLDDAELDQGSMTADIGTVNFADPDLTWIGDLDIGETATIRYSITIDDPITGDAELVNAVVGPIYSNCVPPDATDPDCWEETPLPNVHVSKELVGPENPQPGDVVTYRITAENRGGAIATDEEVSDDLIGVLDDAVYNNDATASLAGNLSYSEPVIAWTGDIDAGDTLFITYTMTVNDYDQLGDATLENTVTGGENCPEDGEVCETTTSLPTYEAVKTMVSSTEVAAGEQVTYQVTITNTSDVTADTADVTDDLAGVLDDAVYNGDANAESGTVSYSEPTLTWTGALAAGQVVTLTYSVTVNPADQLGDGVLENVIAAPNCGEHDGFPTLDHDGCATLNQLQAVQYEKTIASPDGSVKAGDTITYQVTASNVGASDLSDLEFTDDLSDVLEHATFRHDQAATIGTATYQSETLTWTGDLAAGETATVTYSVRLDNDGPAGAALNNVVVGDGPGSNCTNGSNDSSCLAAMTLSVTNLPFTGADVLAVLVGALILTALGALLLGAARRRRSDM